MRRISILLLAGSLSACARPRPMPPPAPVPAVADRPAGFACTAQTATRVPPAQLFAEAASALRTLRLHPVRRVATPPRITVAGATAPTGTGSATRRAAHLYLDWQVAAAEDSTGGPYTILVASGLSNEPPGLTPDERLALYRQASQLAVAFMQALPSVPRDTTACLRTR